MIQLYIYTFFFIFFPIMDLSQDIEYSSLWYPAVYLFPIQEFASASLKTDVY